MWLFWLASVIADSLARGGGAPSFLGPLAGIIFLLIVLIAARMWLNRPDKL